jgi:catechol 2,3-dioxygenase-like lactoylglutathione lyase family enzyme
MIQGVHTMFYTSEAEALRAFIRDKLGFPYIDAGDGWLIFDLPRADMGCHPTDTADPKAPPSGTADISFFCDDIEGTIRELQEKGVEFTEAVKDVGYARSTRFRVPGGFTVQLYEPNYRT